MSNVMTPADVATLLDLTRHRDVYRTGQNGTAAFLAATQLTLTVLPFTPRDLEFRAVLEYNPAAVPGQDQIAVYWAEDHPMSLDAGVLTVQNATFTNGNTFVVFYTGLLTTPLAPAGHDTLGPEESSAYTVIQYDATKLNATVTVINQLLNLMGQQGIYFSPTDFTAAWTNATTLALTNLPIAPTDVQIRGVVEWNAAGVADVYTPEQAHFEYTAGAPGSGTLVVTGATFTNGSQFMVLIADQAKAIGVAGDAAPDYVQQTGGTVTDGLPTELADGQLTADSFTLGLLKRVTEISSLQNILGLGGTFMSPSDFTATYTSGTTLTLTGISFVPVNAQFVGVIEITTTGKHIYYTPQDNYLFTYVAATGILTVTTAAFAATSTFIVIIAGQLKAFDAVLNSLQQVQLNARQQDLVTQQTLWDAALTGDDTTEWINTEGFTEMGLFGIYVTDDTAGAHDLWLRILGNDTDAGTDEFAAQTGELDNATPEIDTYDAPLHPPQITVVATTVTTKYWWRVKISTGTRVCVQILETIPGGADQGTLTLTCKLINR